VNIVMRNCTTPAAPEKGGGETIVTDRKSRTGGRRGDFRQIGEGFTGGVPTPGVPTDEGETVGPRSRD